MSSHWVLFRHGAGGERLFQSYCRRAEEFPARDSIVIEPSGVAEFNEHYRGWHYHHEPEVRFFLAGSGTFEVVDPVSGKPETFKAKRGSFFLIPARTTHRFQSGPRGFEAVRLFTHADGGGTPIPASPPAV